jgi:hypothetical protein
MDTLTDELAAAAYELAPRGLSMKWFQQGLQQTTHEWQAVRGADWDAVALAEIEGFIGVHATPTAVGQYGHDSDYKLVADVDTQAIKEATGEVDLATAFTEEWVAAVRGVIRETQRASEYTPKEFVTCVGLADPHESESTVADALSVTVGTVRGKRGRIEEKHKRARATVALNDDLGRLTNIDADSIQSISTALMHVDSDALPVTVVPMRQTQDDEQTYRIDRLGADGSFEVTVPR